MGRHGRSGKKKKPQNVKKVGVDLESEEVTNAPHSFVFCRGNVGDTVADLTRDFRKVMEPFTASSLKARKANTIKDFLSVAGVLHVSHMSILTATENGSYMKIARVPRGPTLYFKILNYSLARDVISNLKRQLVFQKQFDHPPLVILNNFGGDVVQLKLMATMFQTMFPSINLAKINLNNVRRCVLFNYRSNEEEIDVRHYAIKVVPVGVSKGVKKIVQSKVPNLARFEDISEFITKAQLLSESEAEDDPSSHVTLPQKIASRGNLNSSQSSIRLVEQGPRMTLQLLKIEDGFMAGEVLYHRFVVKTEEEKAALVKKRMEKRRLKEERKRLQAEKVRQKELKKEEHKKKSLEGMKKVRVDKDGLNEEEDDDAAWYKAEVGKDPEHDLFDKKPKGVGVAFKRKRSAESEATPGKRFKHSDDRKDGKREAPGKFKHSDIKKSPRRGGPGGKFQHSDNKKSPKRGAPGGRFKHSDEKGPRRGGAGGRFKQSDERKGSKRGAAGGKKARASGNKPLRKSKR